MDGQVKKTNLGRNMKPRGMQNNDVTSEQVEQITDDVSSFMETKKLEESDECGETNPPDEYDLDQKTGPSSVVAQTPEEQSDIETIKRLLEEAGHQDKVVIEPTPEMIKALEATIPKFGKSAWVDSPLYKLSEDGSVVVPEGLGEQPDGTYKLVVTVPEGYMGGIDTQAEADGMSVEQWVSERLVEVFETWWSAPKSS